MSGLMFGISMVQTIRYVSQILYLTTLEHKSLFKERKRKERKRLRSPEIYSEELIPPG
jgi:hypothetical protein